MKITIAQPVLESSTVPFGDQRGRFCIVLDKQTNGTEIVATEVMETSGTDDTLAFRELNNSKRFTVLKDVTWNLKNSYANMNEGSINLFANGEVSQQFNYYIKFKKPIRVHSSGVSGTVTSIFDNSLSVIGIANGSTATLSYQARIRFTD